MTGGQLFYGRSLEHVVNTPIRKLLTNKQVGCKIFLTPDSNSKTRSNLLAISYSAIGPHYYMTFIKTAKSIKKDSENKNEVFVLDKLSDDRIFCIDYGNMSPPWYQQDKVEDSLTFVGQHSDFIDKLNFSGCIFQHRKYEEMLNRETHVREFMKKSGIDPEMFDM